MTLETLFFAAIIGAFVGWLASVITKRDAEQGWIVNIIVGIVGAIVGNLVSRALFNRNEAALAFDLSAVLWSLVGAIIVCVLLNVFQGKKPV